MRTGKIIRLFSAKRNVISQNTRYLLRILATSGRLTFIAPFGQNS